MMFDGAEPCRARGERRRRLGVDTAGVDGDRDHRTPVGIVEPGHAKRGVEAPREREQNGLSLVGPAARRGDRGATARCVDRCHVDQSPKIACSRSPSFCCSRAPAVAMKMVSSPEIVPMTSLQRAVSMATATLCAAPTVVRSTVKLIPAVRMARTNCLMVEKSFLTTAAR